MVLGNGEGWARQRLAAAAAILLVAACARAANYAPVVSNVRAEQRGDGSRLVDIRFDAADANNDLLTVSVNLTADGAPLQAASFSGDVGTNVVPGVNKLVVWDAGLDCPSDFFSRTVVVSVTADDGGTVALPTGVAIPAGTNQGTDPDFGNYSITVDAFWMDPTEVTKAQWTNVYAWAVKHGYSFDHAGSGKAADHPVHTVNWYDCVKWCNARSEMEGLLPCYTVGTSAYRTGRQAAPACDPCSGGYRLPTSAEWEYAARGGLPGARFPFGDTIGHTLANYLSSSTYSYDTSTTRDYHPDYAKGALPYTSPAGAFTANAFGLHDMAGNVREWCWTQTSTSGNRDIRGGGWNRLAHFLRNRSSNGGSPSDNSNSLGFRTVASAARQTEVAQSAAFIVCVSAIADALDALSLEWNSMGWSVQTNITHDGVDALQASGGSESSQMLSAWTGSPGTVGFWYRGESGGPSGGLVFFPGSAAGVTLSLPADGSWRYATFTVGANGQYWFAWENSGSPVWVDQVTWHPNAGLQKPPPSGGVVDGFGAP